MLNSAQERLAAPKKIIYGARLFPIMAGDGEELRILSELRVREAAASEMVERARREGERMEREAREKAETDTKKLVEGAHAQAAAYLEKARLEAVGEAQKIRDESAMKDKALEKAAEKRIEKAVDFLVDDFTRGSG